jgi:hypothetical protein
MLFEKTSKCPLALAKTTLPAALTAIATRTYNPPHFCGHFSQLPAALGVLKKRPAMPRTTLAQ